MWTKPGAPEQGDNWVAAEEGGRRAETDVLEVWFAGCHNGSFSALFSLGTS
jgi:hypothetical protein